MKADLKAAGSTRSNEMARSSIVALDSALRDKLVTDVAAIFDTAFFAGEGAVAANGLRAPVGIVNYSVSSP